MNWLFFKEPLPVWWTMSQIIPSENRHENKCWPPLKRKADTVSTSASYQQVTGSETFLGDSTQRKRNHCRCLKVRVSPDPSTQAFQYPLPPTMWPGCHCCSPIWRPTTHGTSFKLCALHLCTPKSSLICHTWTSSSVTPCLTQTKHIIGVRPAKHRCRYVQDEYKFFQL